MNQEALPRLGTRCYSNESILGVRLFAFSHENEDRLLDLVQMAQMPMTNSLQTRVEKDTTLPSSSAWLDEADHAWQDDEGSISGSAGHHSSGPDEAVFDERSRCSSPRTSHGSADDFSALEDSCEPRKSASPRTPFKTRSPFRNPSSVRAMQTDITPPRMSSSPSRQRPKIHTPSRQGTPRSVRSYHTPSKLSPSKKITKEHPLVLLHVTLLPLPTQYSMEVLEAVLPAPVLANWNLLQEKATKTVLERGVLIPHPREDYDLLEERLLETLELKQPRILKCGHFHLSPEEEADALEQVSDSEDDSGAEDADICDDCGRRIRNGRFGDAGTGSKRWDIKIFAANGLMRSGAWSAAWREMERVDVEITPWMEDSMKRELELRREDEEQQRSEAEHTVKDEGVGSLDDERLREIYGQNAQDFVDGLADEDSMRSPAMETSQKGPERREAAAELQQKDEVPLQELLTRYLHSVIQDRRNIVIFLLSMLLLLVSSRAQTAQSPSQVLQRGENLVPSALTNLAQTASESATDALHSLQITASPRQTTDPEPATAEPGQAEDEEKPWADPTENILQEILGD